MPPGPTPASGNPTAIEFSGRTAPSASGRCGMGLPNAPTAYTDVCRRWRVPVRHSGRFSGVAAAASTAVVVGGRLGYRAYEDHRTAMARGTCVSAAADLDRAAKECRNPLGADATKSARPSSIIQIDREPARDQARPPGRREGHRTIERDARRFRPTRSPTPPDTSAPGSGRCTAPATTTGA